MKRAGSVYVGEGGEGDVGGGSLGRARVKGEVRPQRSFILYNYIPVRRR